MLHGADEGHIFFYTKTGIYLLLQCRKVLVICSSLPFLNYVIVFRQLLNLTTRSPSQIAFPSEILSRVSTAFSLAIFFSVASMIFNRSLKKWAKSWKRLNLSDQIYWLPNFGQGLGHVSKMVTQRMNLQEFSNVIYVFSSYNINDQT